MSVEKIYTIPVNEAYESDCECPLCALKKKVENDYLEYYLGPSLMEPDTRVVTNKTGFCPEHMGKLNLKEANRLGLGLMLHTHLKDYNDEITPLINNAAPGKATLLKGRNTDYKAKLTAIADKIDARTKSCPICEKVNYTLDRYAEVIVHLFAKDPSFKEKLSAHYHCLPHLALLLRTAAAKMSQNDAADFLPLIAKTNEDAFKALIDDVEWFTLKFDYRNTDKPWGTAKNSIQRSMRFLSEDRSEFDEKRSGKQN